MGANGATGPVLIDTDVGTDIDDAYAIALAIKSGLRIAGISTVSGDTLKRGRIAKKMLHIAGMAEVPVFAGIGSRSMLTHERWVPVSDTLEVHQGIDGLIEHYWRAIERNRDGRVQIVAIGPLSNVAVVRERDANRFDDRVQLIMMGGSFRRGYFGVKLPVPEYNVARDRGAARAIISSRVPTRIVPLDVTAGLKLSRGDMAFLESHAGDDALVKGVIEMTAMFRSSIIGHRLPILFDPATVASMLDPTIASFTTMCVEVTRGGFTRIPRRPAPGAIGKEVCTAIEVGRFYDLFFTIMTGKPRTSTENVQDGGN
ncbi:MAG: nucleoside hydrolase [Candidatus Lokiarchaeota archaeon]|nr:nucleoside hydrolase [Candidatus Lokiarchaeota archaeon]